MVAAVAAVVVILLAVATTPCCYGRGSCASRVALAMLKMRWGDDYYEHYVQLELSGGHHYRKHHGNDV